MQELWGPWPESPVHAVIRHMHSEKNVCPRQQHTSEAENRKVATAWRSSSWVL